MLSASQTDMPMWSFTVIVAERQPIARAALTALLTYDGYRVFQAGNAKDAISLIDQMGHCDALLADLEMPGWQAVVRQASERTGALVIAMEENDFLPNRSALKQHAVALVLNKPLDYRELQALLRDHLPVDPAVSLPARSAATVHRELARLG